MIAYFTRHFSLECQAIQLDKRAGLFRFRRLIFKIPKPTQETKGAKQIRGVSKNLTRCVFFETNRPAKNTNILETATTIWKADVADLHRLTRYCPAHSGLRSGHDSASRRPSERASRRRVHRGGTTEASRKTHSTTAFPAGDTTRQTRHKRAEVGADRSVPAGPG